MNQKMKKFDKLKMYNLYDAHEVKIGSKGYFADTIKSLISLVQEGCSDELHVFTRMSNDHDYIFEADNGYGYHLFYLVEEPKGFRPYKDTDEMIEDFKKRCYNSMEALGTLFVPSIWIKRKDIGFTSLIVNFNTDSNVVVCSGNYYSMLELFNEYTYLDGSPAGIEI